MKKLTIIFTLISILFLTTTCEEDRDVYVTKFELSDGPYNEVVGYKDAAISFTISSNKNYQWIDFHIYILYSQNSSLSNALSIEARRRSGYIYGMEEEYITSLTNLEPNTTYYFKVKVQNEYGESYIIPNLYSFQTRNKSEGFSINGSKKVKFAPGNLQYQPSTKTWRFAEHQYDYVGDATYGNVYVNGIKCNNSHISSTYAGWIDLFGWGTSGWDSGFKAYQPYSTSTTNSDYYSGNNLTSSYVRADWGKYNAIQNGNTVDPAGTWRTLTYTEWLYLWESRANAQKLKGQAMVNNITGFILLPDDWVAPAGISFQSGTTLTFTTNQYTLSQWGEMERNGAIFLPAAGYRIGSQSESDLSFGGYWLSSSANGYFYFLSIENKAASLSSNLGHNDQYRYYGRSVRLVKDL